MMLERKHHIDNLRWLAILLLFPFHASQIWSGGDYYGFYIWVYTSRPMYVFSSVIYPWFMALLFVLAGISSNFALKNRSIKQFVIERFKKLMIPFIFGMLFLIPAITYISEMYFNNYQGTYLNQYIMFFSKATDLTGYKGGFTPAHLWFLLYLFIISLLSLPIIRLQKKALPKFCVSKLPYWGIILLFIPEWLMIRVLNIGGKSIGQFFMLYLLGYFVMCDEKIRQKLKQYRFISLILTLLSGIIYTYLYCFVNLRNEMEAGLFAIYGWLMILTLLGYGESNLNFENKISKYFSTASFPIYILHLNVLIIVAFFAVKLPIQILGQFLLIILLSFAITILCYELISRIPYVNKLFGIYIDK